MKNYDNDNTVDLLYVEYFPVKREFKGTFRLASGVKHTKTVSGGAARAAIKATNRPKGGFKGRHDPACTDRTDWHETSNINNPRFDSVVFYIWGNINSYPQFKGGPILERTHFRWEPEYQGKWIFA